MAGDRKKRPRCRHKHSVGAKLVFKTRGVIEHLKAFEGAVCTVLRCTYESPTRATYHIRMEDGAELVRVGEEYLEPVLPT